MEQTKSPTQLNNEAFDAYLDLKYSETSTIAECQAAYDEYVRTSIALERFYLEVQQVACTNCGKIIPQIESMFELNGCKLLCRTCWGTSLFQPDSTPEDETEYLRRLRG